MKQREAVTILGPSFDVNPLALELNIYSLAHHLCKMWIFYEPRRATLGNTRYFVKEQTKVVRESQKKKN